MLEKLVQRLGNILAYVIIGLAAAGLYFIWQHFTKDDHASAFPMAAKYEPVTFTSFSFTTQVWLRDKDKKDIHLDETTNAMTDMNEYTGVCYRVYEIGIGYTDVNQTLSRLAKTSDAETQYMSFLPRFISVDMTESKQAGDYTQMDCDRNDLTASEASLQKHRYMLRAQMIRDKVYKTHMEQGLDSLKQYTVFLYPQDPGLINKIDKMKAKLADIGKGMLKKKDSGSIPRAAELASLGHQSVITVTMSTFYLYKYKKWFQLKKRFFARKDISRVYFGSRVVDITDSTFLNSTTRTVKLSEPEAIAVDNRIVFVAKSANFKDKELDKEDVDVNAEMVKERSKLIKKLSPRIKMLAKDRLNAYYGSILKGEDNVVVKY